MVSTELRREGYLKLFNNLLRNGVRPDSVCKVASLCIENVKLLASRQYNHPEDQAQFEDYIAQVSAFRDELSNKIEPRQQR